MIIFLLSLLLHTPNASAANASGPQNGVDLSVNFPRIYSINYERLATSQRWSYGVGAGLLPKINFSAGSTPVGVSTFNFDARARWHPFAGGFFLGMGSGYQSISGTATTSVDVSGTLVPVKGTADLGNVYVSPHLGWLYTLGSLIFGLEFGYHIGLGAGSTVNMSITDPAYAALSSQVEATAAYGDLKKSVEDGLNTIGSSSLPYAAIRLGWTF